MGRVLVLEELLGDGLLDCRASHVGGNNAKTRGGSSGSGGTVSREILRALRLKPMTPHDQYELLVESLQLLAADADDQLAYLPDFVVATDEVAGNF